MYGMKPSREQCLNSDRSAPHLNIISINNENVYRIVITSKKRR